MSAKSSSSQRIELVGWTARLGVATAQALAVREDCSVASARARLTAAQRRGLLSRERSLLDGPALFTATRAGLRAAGLDEMGPGRVSPSTARHAAACALVAATLERLYPDHRVMGERELRHQESARASPLASAPMGLGHDGARRLHRPDVVLWSNSSASPLPVAVEVELTVKAPRRLEAICRGWARSRHVDGVLYLVAPEVAAPIARAIEAARAHAKITSVPLDALCAAGCADSANERTVPGHP